MVPLSLIAALAAEPTWIVRERAPTDGSVVAADGTVWWRVDARDDDALVVRCHADVRRAVAVAVAGGLALVEIDEAPQGRPGARRFGPPPLDGAWQAVSCPGPVFAVRAAPSVAWIDATERAAASPADLARALADAPFAPPDLAAWAVAERHVGAAPTLPATPFDADPIDPPDLSTWAAVRPGGGALVARGELRWRGGARAVDPVSGQPGYRPLPAAPDAVRPSSFGRGTVGDARPDTASGSPPPRLVPTAPGVAVSPDARSLADAIDAPPDAAPPPSVDPPTAGSAPGHPPAEAVRTPLSATVRGPARVHLTARAALPGDPICVAVDAAQRCFPAPVGPPDASGRVTVDLWIPRGAHTVALGGAAWATAQAWDAAWLRLPGGAPTTPVIVGPTPPPTRDPGDGWAVDPDTTAAPGPSAPRDPNDGWAADPDNTAAPGTSAPSDPTDGWAADRDTASASGTARDPTDGWAADPDTTAAPGTSAPRDPNEGWAADRDNTAAPGTSAPSDPTDGWAADRDTTAAPGTTAPLDPERGAGPPVATRSALAPASSGVGWVPLSAANPAAWVDGEAALWTDGGRCTIDLGDARWVGTPAPGPLTLRARPGGEAPVAVSGCAAWVRGAGPDARVAWRLADLEPGDALPLRPTGASTALLRVITLADRTTHVQLGVRRWTIHPLHPADLLAATGVVVPLPVDGPPLLTADAPVAAVLAPEVGSAVAPADLRPERLPVDGPPRLTADAPVAAVLAPEVASAVAPADLRPERLPIDGPPRLTADGPTAAVHAPEVASAVAPADLRPERLPVDGAIAAVHAPDDLQPPATTAAGDDAPRSPNDAPAIPDDDALASLAPTDALIDAPFTTPLTADTPQLSAPPVPPPWTALPGLRWSAWPADLALIPERYATPALEAAAARGDALTVARAMGATLDALPWWREAAATQVLTGADASFAWLAADPTLAGADPADPASAGVGAIAAWSRWAPVEGWEGGEGVRVVWPAPQPAQPWPDAPGPILRAGAGWLVRADGPMLARCASADGEPCVLRELDAAGRAVRRWTVAPQPAWIPATPGAFLAGPEDEHRVLELSGRAVALREAREVHDAATLAVRGPTVLRIQSDRAGVVVRADCPVRATGPTEVHVDVRDACRVTVEGPARVRASVRAPASGGGTPGDLAWMPDPRPTPAPPAAAPWQRTSPHPAPPLAWSGGVAFVSRVAGADEHPGAAQATLRPNARLDAHLGRLFTSVGASAWIPTDTTPAAVGVEVGAEWRAAVVNRWRGWWVIDGDLRGGGGVNAARFAAEAGASWRARAIELRATLGLDAALGWGDADADVPAVWSAWRAQHRLVGLLTTRAQAQPSRWLRLGLVGGLRSNAPGDAAPLDAASGAFELWAATPRLRAEAAIGVQHRFADRWRVDPWTSPALRLAVDAALIPAGDTRVLASASATWLPGQQWVGMNAGLSVVWAARPGWMDVRPSRVDGRQVLGW